MDLGPVVDGGAVLTLKGSGQPVTVFIYVFMMGIRGYA